jgi:hypothetical protein
VSAYISYLGTISLGQNLPHFAQNMAVTIKAMREHVSPFSTFFSLQLFYFTTKASWSQVGSDLMIMIYSDLKSITPFHTQLLSQRLLPPAFSVVCTLTPSSFLAVTGTKLEPPLLWEHSKHIVRSSSRFYNVISY